MKKSFLVFIAALLIIIVLLNGCSSDTQYTQPSKIEQTPSDAKIQTETQITATTSSEPEKQPEPKIVTFKVGDTATDNQLKITVNNVKFVSKIDEQNNQFLVAEAPSGQQYAIVDITIENMLSDKTQTVSTFAETTINDQDGYNYDVDFQGLTALSKSFKDGEILPTMKKRGELAYLVPSDATDLKFSYKFDLVTGTTAVFDIK
jgi:hypothetical protein